MQLKIGTFNLNNLFSRYNFELRAEMPGLKEGDIQLTQVKKLVNGIAEQPVTYEGTALKHKDVADREAVIQRIHRMDLDVLAVQEVEDIDTLRYFASHELTTGLYPYLMLIEGNDPRLIDVAIMSKYPLGGATTWQQAVHPDAPHERVFSRDLLQVDILNHDRSQKLLTVFNNHLKSHYVPFTEDQIAGQKAAARKRKQQTEMAEQIIATQTDVNDHYIVLGDMNDGPYTPAMKPLTRSSRLQLVNGLVNPIETRPTPHSSSPPTTMAWTHRFKPSGQPAQYELFDQIWLSPVLAQRQVGAFIDRRTRLGGDGSDHDPAWVVLEV